MFESSVSLPENMRLEFEVDECLGRVEMNSEI